jgi:AcrR family transcriptional regulator
VAVKERLLQRAPSVLARNPKARVADLASAAGASRASFYRHFKSRQALLEALDVVPEPETRERILEAAVEMVGTQGLTGLSMDDLATRAEVSRATLYRLFPGKSALFTALVRAYSPLEPVVEVLTEMGDERPAVVMPEIARTVYRTAFRNGTNRTGLLRALFFEVSGLAPDAEEATRETLARTVMALVVYVQGQMAAGRLRQMHPLLALQSFIGPVAFHVMTRPAAEQVLEMQIDGENAMTELAEAWLRGMAP